jgi:hypothetical protein
MPAKDCYGCTGSVAYALCDENGSIQCSCACDLPTGYSLIDGGDDADLCDAGPGEGGTEEAGAEAGKEAGTDAHPMGDAGKDGD